MDEVETALLWSDGKNEEVRRRRGATVQATLVPKAWPSQGCVMDAGSWSRQAARRRLSGALSRDLTTCAGLVVCCLWCSKLTSRLANLGTKHWRPNSEWYRRGMIQQHMSTCKRNLYLLSIVNRCSIAMSAAALALTKTQVKT